MPTPAIQTLINDAQQVLNLDSISAVRSVVAVSLANANTGTPLNPNLTTQQLWNEFYQVVTRSKSDIESIIANQLMKFLYSPPAPGGVGANKQVIFNDNGILAGDAGLTYDKATDSLVVNGSLGVGGAPVNPLTVFAAASAKAPALLLSTAGSPTYGWDFSVDGAVNGNLFIRSLIGGTKTDVLEFDRATGNVGIGVTPAVRFDSLVADAAESARFRAASGWLRVFGYVDATDKAKIQATNNTNTALQTLTLEGLTVRFNTNGGTALNLNANGAAALLGASTSANGVGITFPATQVASSDANTLDDYEEGTWTPTDGSGAGLVFTVSNCRYTKVGRLVTVQGTVAYPVTVDGSNALWIGFPFTAADIILLSVAYTDASISSFTYFAGVNNAAYLLTPGVNTINSTLSGKSITFFGTYMV